MLDKSSRSHPTPGGPDSQQPSDFARLLAHIEEYPWHYVAGGAFILFCMVAGFLFRLERSAAEQRIVTQYAEAMALEDAEARLDALDEVANHRGHWGEEAQYMLGELALRDRDYERAEAAFQALLDRNADSEFAPEAREGLAFIAENHGDLDAALAGYEEIVQRWSSSFIARRQPYHIGRVLEAQDQIEAAIDAYREQQEVFPDSFAAAQAMMAMSGLAEDYPEFFPEEELEAMEEEELPMDPALGAGAMPMQAPVGDTPPAPAPAPAPVPMDAPDMDDAEEMPVPLELELGDPADVDATPEAIELLEPTEDAVEDAAEVMENAVDSAEEDAEAVDSLEDMLDAATEALEDAMDGDENS